MRRISDLEKIEIFKYNIRNRGLPPLVVGQIETVFDVIGFEFGIRRGQVRDLFRLTEKATDALIKTLKEHSVIVQMPKTELDHSYKISPELAMTKGAVKEAEVEPPPTPGRPKLVVLTGGKQD